VEKRGIATQENPSDLVAAFVIWARIYQTITKRFGRTPPIGFNLNLRRSYVGKC
jgi:hypothetical protein